MSAVPPSTVDRKRLGIELLVAGLLLLPSLFYPLARDQGLFAYAGQVILDGGAPFRDVYDQKGPATHYTFALALAAFGQTTLAVRLLFFVVNLAGTQLAAAVAQRLAGVSSRLAVVACYALVLVQGHAAGPWMGGQVEDVLLPLGLASILVIGSTEAIVRPSRAFWCAFLSSCAFVYKPTAVMTTAFVLLAALGWLRLQHHMPWRALLYRVLCGVCGFIAPVALFAAVLAAQGALDDCWMFVVQHNLGVYARLKSGGLADAAWRIQHNFGGLILLATLGMSWLLGRRTQRPDSPLFVLYTALIVSAAVTIGWQGKYFILYHWTPLAGVLSIAAGVAVARCYAYVSRGRPQPVRALWAAAAAVAVLWWVPVDARFYAQRWPHSFATAVGTVSLNEYRAPYRCGTETAAITYSLAQRLRQDSRPDDRLMVWGYDVMLNFLTGRRCPSRFVMNRVLERDSSPHIATWRAEFMRDMQRDPPEFFVVADERHDSWFISNPQDHLKRFAPLHSFIQEHYEAIEPFGHFSVYRLRHDRRGA